MTGLDTVGINIGSVHWQKLKFRHLQFFGRNYTGQNP
jgi:hypothetical protein